MRKLFLTCLIILALGSLTACTNREQATVGGAAIGGLAGYGLTGGSAIGTAVGAVGGGLIGHAATR